MRHRIESLTIKGIFIFATIIAMVFLLNELLEQPVLVTSLAATVFIIFIRPRSKTARFRCVVGGHTIAALTGYTFVYFILPSLSNIYGSITSLALVAAISVTTASLVMFLLGMEHPPAAGTALTFAFVTGPESFSVLVLTIMMILSLAFLKVVVHAIEKAVIRAEHRAASWLHEHLFEHLD